MFKGLFYSLVFAGIVFGMRTCISLYAGLPEPDDLWEHILIMKHMRNERHLPPFIDEYVPKTDFYYPPLAYYFTSFVSENLLIRYGWLISAIQESILVSWVGFLMSTLSLSLLSVIVSALLYATNLSSARNGLQWSPRTFGAIFAGSTLTAMFFLPSTPVSFIIAISLSIVTVFTHRMSSQSLWLLGTFISVFTRDPSWLLIPALSEILALFLSPELYLRIRTSHTQILQAYHSIFRENRSDPRNNILRNFARTTLYVGPICLLLIGTRSISLPQGMKTVLGGAIVISYATSVVPYLLFLGEGERYTAPIALPASLYYGIAFNDDKALTLLMAVLLVQIAILLTLTKRKHEVTFENDFEALANSVLEITKGKPVICLPYRYNRILAYYGLRCFALTPSSIVSIPKFVGDLPHSVVTGPDLRDPATAITIAKGLGINFLLVNENEYPSFHLKISRKIGEWNVYEMPTYNINL